MTMPHLMNCGHDDNGWCLDCVKKQHEELQVQHIAWMQCVINVINDLNAHSIDNDPWKRMVKLTEEVGELAQAIAKERRVEFQREESVDVVIASIGMFAMLGGDAVEFMARFNEKIQKWSKCKKGG